jgi:hypothetical protein
MTTRGMFYKFLIWKALHPEPRPGVCYYCSARNIHRCIVTKNGQFLDTFATFRPLTVGQNGLRKVKKIFLKRKDRSWENNERTEV